MAIMAMTTNNSIRVKAHRDRFAEVEQRSIKVWSFIKWPGLRQDLGNWWKRIAAPRSDVNILVADCFLSGVTSETLCTGLSCIMPQPRNMKTVRLDAHPARRKLTFSCP